MRFIEVFFAAGELRNREWLERAAQVHRQLRPHLPADYKSKMSRVLADARMALAVEGDEVDEVDDVNSSPGAKTTPGGKYRSCMTRRRASTSERGAATPIEAKYCDTVSEAADGKSATVLGCAASSPRRAQCAGHGITSSSLFACVWSRILPVLLARRNSTCPMTTTNLTAGAAGAVDGAAIAAERASATTAATDRMRGKRNTQRKNQVQKTN